MNILPGDLSSSLQVPWVNIWLILQLGLLEKDDTEVNVIFSWERSESSCCVKVGDGWKKELENENQK